MKFFAVASALVACASTAVAATTEGCITMRAAKTLVARFANVQGQTDSDLGDFLTTANIILSKDYSEISDSITMLMGKPLGSGPVFNSKAEYLATLTHSPPQTGVNTLGVYVSGCSKILWKWERTNVGTAQYPVTGYSIFTVNRKNQLTKCEIEFNSLAWNLDINPPAPAATTTEDTTD